MVEPIVRRGEVRPIADPGEHGRDGDALRETHVIDAETEHQIGHNRQTADDAVIDEGVDEIQARRLGGTADLEPLAWTAGAVVVPVCSGRGRAGCGRGSRSRLDGRSPVFLLPLRIAADPSRKGGIGTPEDFADARIIVLRNHSLRNCRCPNARPDLSQSQAGVPTRVWPKRDYHPSAAFGKSAAVGVPTRVRPLGATDSGDCRQRLAGRGDRLLDVLLRVRRRQKRRLELAARQINAAIHHRPEEAAEPGRVALLGACRNR